MSTVAAVVAKWPPSMPTAPDAARIAQIKAGQGYAERRVYKSTQWHDSEAGDVDNMRHEHIEVAHPEVVGAEIVPFDFFATAFHFQGGIQLGIRKFKTAGLSAPKWMPVYVPGREAGRREEPIPVGSAGHQVVWWTPAAIDFRAVTVAGLYQIECDNTFRRPDGELAHARLIWKMWIDPTGQKRVPRRARLTHGEGWVTPEGGQVQFGYMQVQMFGAREYLTDPAEHITVKARAAHGRLVRVMICKNPDLHAHPANYGEILHDWTEVFDKTEPFEKLIPQPDLVAGDRLMARIVDATVPEIGAGATLAVVTLSAA